MRVLSLLLLVAINAQATERFTNSDKPLVAAEAFARAAHQEPLQPTNANSVRVWIRSYMTGAVRGYVLSKSGSFSCRASSDYADGVVSVSPAECQPYSQGSRALKSLKTLPVFRQEDWDCPFEDGAEVFVEGVRNGERFAIRVGNPGFCADTDSKAIVELLKDLQ
jgi:hypothetical protein